MPDEQTGDRAAGAERRRQPHCLGLLDRLVGEHKRGPRRGGPGRSGTGGYAPARLTMKDGRWQVAGTFPSVTQERTARIAQNELSAVTTL